jgi:glycosyltransferase involved in cell wall biosynthesis
METKLSVILPAKNEKQTIASVVKNILRLLPRAEVIVVNDGSTDDTALLAEQAGARVIHHPYPKGNGAAVKSGARAANGEVLVFLDADGQHDPADIPRLLARLENYDMVIGARQNGSQANIGRDMANRLYNLLASYMTGQRVEDLTSGLRVVRADKFREFLYLLPNGFSYPTTITMAFFRAGYSVAYEPIHASQRNGSSHLKPWKDGVRFLLIIFKIGSLYSPLKLFAPASLAFLLLGLGWYCYTLITAGRFTNMSALLLTSSALVFLIGLVSEQITQLMYKDSGSRR